jgi:hypothetical protein
MIIMKLFGQMAEERQGNFSGDKTLTLADTGGYQNKRLRRRPLTAQR